MNEDAKTKASLPLIAITMGDVAGVGPEVVAAAVTSDEVLNLCRPVVIGDPVLLDRAAKLIDKQLVIKIVQDLSELQNCDSNAAIPCWNPTSAKTENVSIGKIDAEAGQAAYDWLIAATDAALAGEIDGIVTAPLNKAALHLAGHHYPGHTEILAERCGVSDFAMMLYLPEREVVKGPHGLGVAHVTLHTSIASVPELLNSTSIQEKIHLVDSFLKRIGCAAPRVGVCALNPHGGEGGLFGNEEAELIAPAVALAKLRDVQASGPFPADTLLQQAVSGKYDGIVAMYHDQGHIALKLIAFQKAVNVTLGLPIVRTSPSHGTAFDIAWQNKVESAGMISAIRIAVELSKTK
ncbi:MAG: 4-hydroxythreonine-4-phosphate dehydrogenase PdxA [Planctomicrobium sp.]|jgi:4-hydroxythreonine-4-phosphate dehydrogenase|nr:4-hydroxythreonine-4-phosphate dehydrogenase PdxA [Planctomicrobium sp.]